jgi:DNA modification methylase
MPDSKADKEIRVSFATEMRYLEDLIIYDKNNKDHPEEQIKEFVISIQKYGVVLPLIIDKNNVIIAGHGTREACLRMGIKEVACIVRDDLSEAEARGLRIAHNKISELGKRNKQNLLYELRDLGDQWLAGLFLDLDPFVDNDKDKEEIEDDAPGVLDKYVVQKGDIFQLGEHILMCGDSSDKAMVAKLMGGKKADMVFTDPPYNVAYVGKGKNTSNGIKNDDMSDAAFETMLSEWFARYRENIKTTAGMYVFHSTSTQALFEKHITDAGFVVKCQLVWNKPTAAMGWSDYRWKHEPFFYCGVKDASPEFYGDRTHTTVIDFTKSDAQLLAMLKHAREAEKEGKTTIWTMKRDPVKDYVHPTQKPIELIGYALANSSKA